MPTLTDDINTAVQAAVNKLTTLISTGDVKDVTLASKALEALRGTASLQNILAQSQAALTTLAADLTAAQTTLTNSKNSHVTTLTNLKNSLAADLNALSATLTAAFNAEAATVGTPRIGDIWFAMYPNATSLPAKVSICDGRYVPLADMAPLVAAWGLGSGGTICQFVLNYNAGADVGHQIIVDGTGLRLPDLTGKFLKANTPSLVGTYQPDAVGPHTHAAPSNPYVTSPAGTGSGVTVAGGSAFRLDTSTNTGVTSGSETLVKNFSALPLVRFK